MHTVELLYYILLSCFYDRPEDGILRKRISTFYSTDLFSQFHLFPRTMMYSGNISMIFSAPYVSSYVSAEIWLMTPFHMNIHLIGSFS